MPDPIDEFKWTGHGGPKQVLVYMLEEGPLTDAEARVSLCKQVRIAGAQSETLAALGEAVKRLAQAAGLDANFYTEGGPSNPLERLVSIGFVPHVEPPEPRAMWA